MDNQIEFNLDEAYLALIILISQGLINNPLKKLDKRGYT
jgi:hypothetical protein